MSFKFNWDSFANDNTFYDQAKALLADALNKGKNPPILADTIKVRDLCLGDDSPQLEVLEVGDLADDRFRGIFKLAYDGNASITLATKIRANPLQVYAMSAPAFAAPRFHGASHASPLSLPLTLTLSEIKLSGIVILVFSKAKGLTLVFRNDPLQSVRVTSTFDALPGIARFLQSQIETQIRSLFREDLPAILHKLSHRWTPSGSLMREKQRLQQIDQKAREAGLGALPEHLPPPSPGGVLFADISPDMPTFSAKSMARLRSLCASQLTLSLATPAIPETAVRANLHRYEEKSRGGQYLPGCGVDEIARIQSRNYFKNSRKSPKRRVVKLTRSGAAAPRAVAGNAGSGWTECREKKKTMEPSQLAPPPQPEPRGVTAFSCSPVADVLLAGTSVAVPAAATSEKARVYRLDTTALLGPCSAPPAYVSCLRSYLAMYNCQDLRE